MEHNLQVMNIKKEKRDVFARPAKLEFVKNVMSYISGIMSVLRGFNEESI